jgi:two-component system response regulator AtoC
MNNPLLKYLAGDFLATFAPEGLKQIDMLFEHLKFDAPAKLEVNFNLAMPPEMRRKILNDIGVTQSNTPAISKRYLPYLMILNNLINRYQSELQNTDQEEIVGFIWQEGRRLKLFEYEIQQLIDSVPQWLQKIAKKCVVELTPANICEVDSSEPPARNGAIAFNGMIGKSEKMRSMFSCLERISDSDLSILVQGESGTGKELVAHAIHSLSSFSNKSFIPVNCGALPDSIIESELFGHEKGSFTGADLQKKGYFEIADGGTIFLDEITETSLNTQVKLLRVLQERQFYRVGGSKPVRVNVRIIAATNRDILELVKNGSFRHDLYYRINEMTINLPSLRERKVDLPPLTKHFINNFARQNNKPIPQLSAEAEKLLTDYNWPGNIRELENALKRAVVLADEIILPQHFPPIIREYAQHSENELYRAVPSDTSSNNGSLADRVAMAERRIILQMLKKHQFNVSKTASELEVSRRTLQRKIKLFAIEKK